MNKLIINFFKNSIIYYNDIEIRLPFIKAEGMLYYLIINQLASRDELCDLLWEDFSEPLAQKNLRNTVYVLRKKFYEKIITIPKKNMLQFTEDIEIVSDLAYLSNNYKFENEEDISNFLDFYAQDFLEHCNIKSCNNFYNWLLINQEKYRKIYTEKLFSAADKAKQLNLIDIYEKCLFKLISLDIYEEKYYLQLMIFLAENNRKKECLNLYNKLKKLLNDDLFIEPQEKTKKFIENIFQENIDSLSNENNFYGRINERNSLKQDYQLFIQNQAFSSYLIIGEPGIGKSKLIDDFLNNVNNDDCIKLDITCYRVDKEISLKLWDSILEELAVIIVNKKLSLPSSLVNNISNVFPSFNINESLTVKDHKQTSPVQIEIMIIQLLEIISKKHKLVLVVDNLQWVDESSINLLVSGLIKCRNNLMFIATSRDGHIELVKKLYWDLYNNVSIKRIFLSRFTQDETKEMIELINKDALDQYQLIYKESEGNPFFITEILNNFAAGMDIKFLNQRMSDLIGSRIIMLSENSRSILNICSLFQSDFSLNLISNISGIFNILLVDIIDELIEKKLIVEFKNSKNEELYFFSHQKTKEYVYSNISSAKLKVLHRRIAQYYESNLDNNQNDRFYYHKLIYHYRKAQEDFKALKYRIKYLELVFRFQHELFPLALEKTSEKKSSTSIISEKIIENEFAKIDAFLKNTTESRDSKEYAELEIVYLHLFGRYYEIIGDSSRAIIILEKMTDLATKWQKNRYVYEGYLQLILHGINVYDLDYVDKIIKKAKEVDYINDNPMFSANIMRHEGYNCIHRGEFFTGEKMIFDAIEVLLNLNTEEDNLIISASYYCLGESQFMQGNFGQSLKYYKKSLEYNQINDTAFNLSVIYLGMGMDYFHQNDLANSVKYLNQSLKYFDQSVFVWRKTILYCYLAKVSLWTDKIDLAIEYYGKAISVYPKYSSRLEKEELLRLQEAFKHKNIFIDNKI